MKKNHKPLIIKLSLFVVFMLGFCALMVPLYTLVCKKIGLNGRFLNGATPSAVEKKVDLSRNVRVVFSGTIHGNLKFAFKPLEEQVVLHPGKEKRIYFFAENATGHPITVQAIPSITPSEAIPYFKKIECFCFTQQHFKKGEKADMPVRFYVESGLPKDIHDITLSYTLFDASAFTKKVDHKTPVGKRIEL